MIELESEIDPLRRVALHDFSYSRLNTFDSCELQYYYGYLLREPQDFGAAATLGNIIHKALEVTIEDGYPISPTDLIQSYKEAIPEYDPEDRIPDTMLSDGEEMLLNYVNDNPGEIGVYANELPFSFVLGPARFNGFIDFVSVHPTHVRIRDYKSGKKEVPYAQIPTNLQLGIYALYMKSLFPDREVLAELYYLRTGKARGHLFTDDDLVAVEARLLEAVRKVLNKEHFKATPNERMCRWCTYAKNGVCPTGQRRLRKAGVLRD